MISTKMKKLLINTIIGVITALLLLAITTLLKAFMAWELPTFDWFTIRTVIAMGIIAGPLLIGQLINRWLNIYD